jgi:hypothetical protein
MSDVVDFGHQLLRYSHIGAAFLGLALYWIPIFAVKGSRLHIRIGKIFIWCAAYVGTTGLISSSWAILDPLSFVSGTGAPRDPQALPYQIERLRFFFSILGFLSLGILCGVVFGIRVIRTRQAHEKLPSPLLLGLESAMGLASFGLAIYGMWNLYLAFTGQHFLRPAETGKYWIPTVLGLFGLLGTSEDLKYILRPRPTPMAWWYKHMENMIGIGIGFHTAFLVFGLNRLVNFQLSGPWQLVPWLLPATIGLPASVLWTRYYKRKFGELEPARRRATANT